MDHRGIDVHKRDRQIYMRAEGGEVSERRICTEPERFAAVLGSRPRARASARWPGAAPTAAGWLFVAGTAIFSGGLYVGALTGARGLGAITPLGGACFLLGWAAVAWAALTGR